MIISEIKSAYMVSAMLIIIFAGPFFKANAFSKSMISEGLVIEETFRTGFGESVGKIRLVQGKAVIIHSNIARGYLAEKDIPIFKGDTIITMKKGRIQIGFNDGSIITMTSESQLTINRSVYDPESKSRSSFIRMGLGKVRFFVRKLTGFRVSEFKVKTKTAVAGVRGSDFIIRSTEESTEITSLKNTVLEVTSMTGLEEPILLRDFERTTVETENLPSDAEKVSPEVIEQMIMEMMIIPGRTEPHETLRIQKEKAGMRKAEKHIGRKPVARISGSEIGKSVKRAKPESARIHVITGKPAAMTKAPESEKVLPGPPEARESVTERLTHGPGEFPGHKSDRLPKGYEMPFGDAEPFKPENMGYPIAHPGHMVTDISREFVHDHIKDIIREKDMECLPPFPPPPGVPKIIEELRN